MATLAAAAIVGSITVVAMSGAATVIHDATASDSILRVKERVFAANPKLPVHRQLLVYRPGPHGIKALADDETLRGAGVPLDDSAEIDVLLEPLTAADLAALGSKV